MGNQAHLNTPGWTWLGVRSHGGDGGGWNSYVKKCFTESPAWVGINREFMAREKGRTQWHAEGLHREYKQHVIVFLRGRRRHN